ncbi:iron-sulfur cluster assembly scaffold protein [Candidatus Parcubacteria bacterium]|nr:MAG: iron-sulfur cluster assembly scaffold protein [Candidatus Parcubacteria bacterium]
MTYTQTVLNHFKNPHNQGSMADADAVGEAGNPMCGDVMKIYLKIKNNKIKDIKFETLGCAAAIACSSILTDMAKGKDLDSALKISKADIVKELGDLPPVKIHCSVLAHHALTNAINIYQKKLI